MSTPSRDTPKTQDVSDAQSGSDTQPLARLVSLVLEDADTKARRDEDRKQNEARAVVLAAEDHVRELTRAATELGRTRGSAAELAVEREADREIESVYAGAFEALEERTLRRLALALGELPKEPAHYERALESWASQAAPEMDRPCQVFTSRKDRPALYDVLLSAGAEDFQVLHDPKVHAGFVVRDLDGRTVFDATPAARAEAAMQDVRTALKARITPFAAPPDDAG